MIGMLLDLIGFPREQPPVVPTVWVPERAPTPQPKATVAVLKSPPVPAPPVIRAGDRVKIKSRSLRKSPFGVVVAANTWTITVLRDGFKRNSFYRHGEVELIEHLPANIYADWLEERGHTEAAKDLRANFPMENNP